MVWILMRILLVLLMVWPSWLLAHPVAQGGMEVEVKAGEIRVKARVSNEQVFVQARHAVPEPENIEAAFEAHGAYVLGRMELAADGTFLPGTVENVEVPVDRTVRGFAIYELRYLAPAPPREIRMRQSMMNEIPYAPGNAWEATFVVRATVNGKVLREGALFTHREPLVIDLTGKAAPSAGVFGEFLRHGIYHILEGWDHLLFMAALVLAVKRVGELIAVVTAFTVAHTLTLALSVFDVVRLPSHIVEPMIAGSIVVVAVQNIFWPARAHGWLRLGLAFGFGLFHGLGFAGGLLEAMQSGESVGRALLAFSLGVEIGHQVVVLPVFLGLVLIRRWLGQTEARERFSVRAMQWGSTAIAAAGCFYFVTAVWGE
jgi:hypothetical protein